MDEALSWSLGRIFGGRKAVPTTDEKERVGGDDEPVFVGTVSGPIEIEMAKDALRDAGIPALVKQNTTGTVYGFTTGAFGAAEVWALPAVAERTYDILVGMGLIEEAPTSDDE
jgi:hypothetical protein